MSLLRNLDLAGLSPYLIQHRDNPVDWYPWGEEAFEVARRTERPVLLSVGYATCHWCHVMERESFHDEETARFMNRNFVSVKVDREERPDIDSIYMDAVHAMTGRGGWPMTVFLTPDGSPFFAGTYFPDVERHGMPSFRRVLEAISHAWRHRRSEVQTQAGELTRRIGQILPPAEHLPGHDRVVGAYQTLAGHFDAEHGGLGGAPKFPQAPVLEFLTRIAGSDWASGAQTILTTTLERMASGGIRDHLGGGFSRYAVDRTWLVPHFEKMLYDNADLARLYLRTSQLTGETRFRRVAVETIEYLLRDMTHPGGGFFAAEDADSEGVEGKFYVFGHDEFHEVVGSEDGPAAAAYFGVSPAGNFEGSNVLHEAVPVEVVGEKFGMAPHEVEALLAGARERLLARRAGRIRPGLDHKIITAWNGLALRSLAVAGAVLGEPRYLDAARANARFVLDEMRRPDGLLARTWSNGLSPVAGFLEDHAAYGLGLLELYQATGEAEWFHTAGELIDLLEDHFGGPQGVVFASASGVSGLVVRPPDQQDNPSASGASLAAECYLLMGHLTGDFSYHDRFEQIIRSGDRLVEAAPSAVGHLLAVLATANIGYREVAITGLDALRWARTLAAGYHPNLVVAPASDPGDSVPILAGRYREGRTLAYVCERGVCRTPVSSVQEMLALL